MRFFQKVGFQPPSKGDGPLRREPKTKSSLLSRQGAEAPNRGHARRPAWRQGTIQTPPRAPATGIRPLSERNLHGRIPSAAEQDLCGCRIDRVGERWTCEAFKKGALRYYTNKRPLSRPANVFFALIGRRNSAPKALRALFRRFIPSPPLCGRNNQRKRVICALSIYWLRPYSRVFCSPIRQRARRAPRRLQAAGGILPQAFRQLLERRLGFVKKSRKSVQCPVSLVPFRLQMALRFNPAELRNSRLGKESFRSASSQLLRSCPVRRSQAFPLGPVFEESRPSHGAPAGVFPHHLFGFAFCVRAFSQVSRKEESPIAKIGRL